MGILPIYKKCNKILKWNHKLWTQLKVSTKTLKLQKQPQITNHSD